MNARTWLGAALLALALGGCVYSPMRDQGRLDPYDASPFFPDGTTARAVPPNTVARGLLQTDTHLYQGLSGGRPATEFPFPITAEVLARGQERYAIFCAPCHGGDGAGQGIIVQRGFTPPPSFHDERLRAVPPGHYFQVMTNGLGVMYSYADRLTPEERWAIAAYIRALQLSTTFSLEDLPADQQERLERIRSGGGEPEPAAPGGHGGAEDAEE
jgi:mono/diheme cytochrome c family protein